ncbi:MAG: CRISPR-associated endoribonuclease Cas6 [Bacteroidales bacterium]|nr:CRISPR-associated endoribonuclease Cas6 [Bacteroidales bacterium]
MRFRLKLAVDKYAFGNLLPFNYQYEQSAVIYKTLSKSDAAYSEWLHENGFQFNDKQFKLFTYARLNIPKLKPQGDFIQILCDMLEWDISFLPERSTQNFISGLFQQQTFELGNADAKVQLTVKNIDLLPSPEFSETMKFKTLSSICLASMRPEGGLAYLKPDDSGASELIRSNLLMKYKAFTGEDFPQDDFPFDFKVLSKPESSLITIKANTPEQSKVRGFKCRFQLTAPVELMKIAYESGIGGKGSLGFGMIGLV